MKKSYIIPEALTVVLGTCKMMAESAPNVGIGTEPGNPNDIDVKEEVGFSDVNLWDEEW